MILLLLRLAFAAEPAEAPITLDRAVEIALHAGVDATTAQLAVEAARSTLHTRAQAGLPDLTFALSASATLASTYEADVDRRVALPGGSAAARVQSSTPLVAGGRIRADNDAAEASLRSADATLERTVQDLRYTLAGAMLDLAEARGDVALAEARLSAEQALGRQIAAQVAAGSRTRADALQQDAAVAGVERDLSDARASVAASELALVQVLRLDPAGRWRFEPPEAGPAAGEAADGRADLRAAAADVDAADAAVRAARSGLRPAADLTLGASTALDTAASGPLADQLRDDARAWATIDLSLPVFDRAVTHDAVTRAQLDARAARLRLDATRTDAAAQQARARLDADTAAAALAAAERQQTAARAAAAVIHERYAAGSASVYEVQAANATLAAAERAALRARIAVRRAAFERAWADGR